MAVNPLMISIDQYIKTATPSGTKGEHSLLFDCPRCKGLKKLEYQKQRKVWFCHKCGVGGRQETGDRIRESREEYADVDPSDFWSEHLSLYSPLHPGSMGWNYLQETRKLSSHLIRDLRPHEGPLTSYCYFPLYGLGQSQPSYFVGRSFLRHAKRKYLNPTTGTFPVTKNQVLWGLHRIKPRQDEVILCEGIFDAVWDKRRVALLGKTLSQQQLEILREIRPRKVSVMLDAGVVVDASRIAYVLGKSAAWKVDYFDLPCEDPDYMGSKSLERFRRRYV